MRNVLAVVVAALMLTGCATTTQTPPVIHSRVESRPVQHAASIAVVGDSITAWAPPFAGNPAQSWVYTATDNNLPLVGGWALPGATLGQMSTSLTPAPGAYFLIIMGGTNDIYQGVPIPERLALIDQIAATVHARNVILSSVAPYNPDPAAAAEWNAVLEVHATAMGWYFIDPWMNVRTPEQTWVAGADYGDGVHPNPSSAAIIGVSVRTLVDQFYGR